MIWPQSPIVPTCPAPSRRLQTSVHGVVLRHQPLPILIFLSDGEQFPVGCRLAWAGKPFAPVVKNRQRRRALPLRQIPGKQRMLRLRVANEVGILLAVVVLPTGEQLVAVAVPQLAKKQIGAVLNRPVAQRIHSDANWQSGQRVAVFGPRQHWPLIAKPPDVAQKSKHQQRSGTHSNSDLCSSKSHLREILSGWQITARLPPAAAGVHVPEGSSGGGIRFVIPSCSHTRNARRERVRNLLDGSLSAHEEKGHGLLRALGPKSRLLFLVFSFFLDRLNPAIVLRLRFGIFHRLPSLCVLFGAGFGALLAFFVQHFFAA